MKTLLLLSLLLICSTGWALDDFSKCTIQDSYEGYKGVWLIYDCGNKHRACNLEYYRNGISLKEILDSK